MKKLIFLITLLIVFPLYLSFSAECLNKSTDLFNDTIDSLYSAIDDKTVDILDELGMVHTDLENIGDFSLSSIIEYFSVDFKTKLIDVLKQTVLVLGLIVLMSLINLPSNKNDTEMLEYISVCVIIVFSFSKVSAIINTLATAITLSSKFLLTYVPVFAALIAMSGNVSSALSYNTVLITAAEICSGFLSVIAKKATGIYFSLVIGFSVNRNVNLTRFVSSYSKCISVIIGFASSLFVAFFTVKSVFSANIDTVSAKGIRFVISSLIPVVGGAISDAYSTLLGSIGVVKGSVAIIGIAMSLIINLPVMFEGVCFCLSYNFLSFAAELLSSTRLSSVLKAVSIGIKILLLVEVFTMFILIVSTAVMVSFKATV